MIHLLILAVHLLATIAKLVRPGGIRAVVVESLLLKHQLLISSRARRRAPNLNSVDRLPPGSWIAVRVTKPNPQARGHSEAQNLVQIPCGAQEMQSVALLVGRSSASRPEGTVEGTHRRDRRVQTPPPPRSRSPHCTGDCARLCHRYQQRHRPPGARETLSTGGRNRWPVLAELYRTCQGQPVERRSVPLRIDTPAQPLGHGGDGRVHTPDHRLWR